MPPITTIAKTIAATANIKLESAIGLGARVRTLAEAANESMAAPMLTNREGDKLANSVM
jgi:hypothetical protein